MEENNNNYDFIKVNDLLQQIEDKNNLTNYDIFYNNTITEY